jgi:YVTN family beta-propeller protein
MRKRVTIPSRLNPRKEEGSGPYYLAYDPSNKDIYVPNDDSRTVSIVSRATNGMIVTVSVGWGPVSATFNKSDGDVYVSNQNSATVSIIPS